jgi:hypothetical protein
VTFPLGCGFQPNLIFFPVECCQVKRQDEHGIFVKEVKLLLLDEGVNSVKAELANQVRDAAKSMMTAS